ncbi:ArnT family glycosyltransferase [Laceyella putida]|uniref:ArnT family glycosyltransferase n=1 Tax=Laceyella putida TaxID=110101 RepID=A0ABW2RLH1_9BACL
MKTKQGQQIDWLLIGIALLSAFLNIFNIWNDENGNAYYTAAVTSMLQSFHNFFYASFDPAGFVTVDKPPVVFWIQTLFAYVFGVHGWSVILPQALAGVGSVLLIYHLVKPSFGGTAARLASLVMACTPIAVAVSRTNNIDSMLVFTLLVATWMLFKGIRKEKPAWVLGAFAVIGVGFNMKMLQAYMVVPAFILFTLLAFKSGWKKKWAILAAATVVMAGVSVSWALAVDSIPASKRPYIGSSQTNSVLELAFGYNGVSRLTGMNRGGMGGGARGGEMPNMPPMQQHGNNTVNRQQTQQDGNNTANRQQMQQNGNNMPGGFGPNGHGRQGQGGGGMFGTGQPGPLRLFQTELSGQTSWLLPFVAFASVGLLVGIRRREPLTAKQKETLFWLAWLFPMMVFFSIAGFFHHYYLIMLAPAIAALAGAGWVELWNQYRNKEGWKMWLLPSGILATTAFELIVLQPFQEQIGVGWSIGIGAAGLGLALALFLAANKPKLSSIAALTAMAGMLVMLVAPLYWAATPLLYGGNSMLPQAGPSQQGFGAGPGMGGGPNFGANTQSPDQQGYGQKEGMGDGANSGTQSESPDQQGAGPRQGMGGGPNSRVNTKLLEYVTKHNTGEKYLFATTNASSAAPYIIKTGKAVMAMNGWASDQILTVEKIKEIVKNKEVKYFLIPSGSGGFEGRGGNSEVMDWIRKNSTEVPEAEWKSSSSQSDQGGPMGRDGEMALYKIKKQN